MKIPKLVSNPYVLGGGVLIGLVVLLSRGGSTGGGGGASDPVLAYNLQAMALEQGAARVAGEVQVNSMALDVRRTLGLASTMANMFAVNSSAQVQNAEISAGVIKTMATSATNRDIELSANFLSAYQSIQKTYLSTSAATQIARINGETSKAVAQINADASVKSAYIGGVASVARAQAQKQNTTIRDIGSVLTGIAGIGARVATGGFSGGVSSRRYDPVTGG